MKKKRKELFFMLDCFYILNPRNVARPGTKVYRRNKINNVNKAIHTALSHATSNRNLTSIIIIRNPITGIKSVK